MNVNIKKLNKNAVIPSYAKNGDAGMDLTAVSKSHDDDGNVVYGTGLAFEIPDGYVGLLLPRSSNTKKDLIMGNSVGVLDSGYRGEVFFKFKPSIIYKHNDDYLLEILKPQTSEQLISESYDHLVSEYEVGDRIGQIIIMPYPKVIFIEVEELGLSERGISGFGSTGK